MISNLGRRDPADSRVEGLSGAQLWRTTTPDTRPGCPLEARVGWGPLVEVRDNDASLRSGARRGGRGAVMISNLGRRRRRPGNPDGGTDPSVQVPPSC